ncbi:uncharacterized protein ARMOST_02399 [Armillaria ostoyae]|uniref:Uncharacterized protein n=1 Tax=Armillaria ostoyae TaxID=47428 RepID=A0A284QRS8_ARMOS|nr:uncharacterized protein ARMOST_02399 [Armillaria ostoyae]
MDGGSPSCSEPKMRDIGARAIEEPPKSTGDQSTKDYVGRFLNDTG